MRRRTTPLIITSLVLVAVLVAAASAAARPCEGSRRAAAEGWQRATVTGGAPALQFSALAMADANVGVAVGDREQEGAVMLVPVVFRTSDGGATWAAVTDETLYGQLSGVTFSDPRHAWAVGGDYGTGDRQAALMLASADGGQTWTRVSLEGHVALHDVQFPTPSVGYATGDGGMLYTTTDGGAHWTASRAAASDVGLSGLSFTDATHGWICGGQGNEDWYGGRCYATTDGGATWKDVSPDPDQVVLDCSFVAGGEGWVTGQGPVIFHTSDGGATWAKQSTPVGAAVSLTTVCFVDAQDGWAAGLCWPDRYATSGWAVILHTTDGGQTWVQQDCGVVPAVSDVAALAAQTAWAAGDQALVLRTADGGGAGFTPQARPQTSALNAVAVRRGATATFRYSITDPGVPYSRAIVLVLDARHHVKKHVDAGMGANGEVRTCTARIGLRPGRYTWKLVCTDYAGRTQSQAGSRPLVVK